jgi:hypothetical protein
MSDAERLERVARAIRPRLKSVSQLLAQHPRDRISDEYLDQAAKETAQSAIDVLDKIAAEEFEKTAEETIAETLWRTEEEVS